MVWNIGASVPEREVAVIGQGTWYLDGGHRESTIAALRRGLDLGLTHLAHAVGRLQGNCLFNRGREIRPCGDR